MEDSLQTYDWASIPLSKNRFTFYATAIFSNQNSNIIPNEVTDKNEDSSYRL